MTSNLDYFINFCKMKKTFLKKISRVFFVVAIFLIIFSVANFSGLLYWLLSWRFDLSDNWVFLFIGLISLLLVPKLYLDSLFNEEEERFSNRIDYTGRYLCVILIIAGIFCISLFFFFSL